MSVKRRLALTKIREARPQGLDDEILLNFPPADWGIGKYPNPIARIKAWRTLPRETRLADLRVRIADYKIVPEGVLDY